MSDIEQHDSVNVFVGVGVDTQHRAVALDRKGERLSDSALPNDEAKLRALIGKLKEHGQILCGSTCHRRRTSGRRCSRRGNSTRRLAECFWLSDASCAGEGWRLRRLLRERLDDFCSPSPCICKVNKGERHNQGLIALALTPS